MTEMKVYRIELEDKGDAFIADPRIPIFRMQNEDDKTERICVAPTIIGCVRSLTIGDIMDYAECDIDHKDIRNIYLYSTMVPVDKIIQPDTTQVADAFITGELWITEPIRMYKEARYKIRKHVNLKHKLSRFAFTREFCDEIVDRFTAPTIYGNIESFSYLGVDSTRQDEQSDIEEVIS